MKTVNFIFGIHNHQPVGNFDFVIEDAFQKSYLPFIETVEGYPNLAISFHFSGCLLEWLEKTHPDYLDRIAALVKRGNVEIISGGFFEPVLAMIPDTDKVGQIRMMNDYIQRRFGYQARGLWLTERVWEPHLAKPIAEAGIRYITVDDYHFLGTGKMEKDLIGHFITEEQGKTLSIFPINQKLRYAIPFKDPQDTVEYLRTYATEDGDNAIVMADDGEKFGVWPGTYETVFEGNWLRDFFQLLEENRDWLHTQTFNDYFANHAPKGRIYLPTASYFEMSEWSLPWEAGEKFSDLVHEFENAERLDDVRPFIKGGIWRNFLYKYDESNWMQKKVLYLSRRCHAIDAAKFSSGQKARHETAKEHIWRAMCNCAYWHGIFGGLYLPHLRHAIYTELLAGEQLLNELEMRNKFTVETLDFDGDGRDEILASYQNLHIVLMPSKGAVMSELSLLDKRYNLLNTLKRYHEAYHRQVLEGEKNQKEGGSIHDQVRFKEKGLEQHLKYDAYPRKNLVDHIIHTDVSLDTFRNGEYYEDSDFIQGKYESKIDRSSRTISFQREGWINWQRFTIRKEIRFVNDGIRIRYHLQNTDTESNSFRFGSEFNFAMLGGNAPDRYYLIDEKRPQDSALASVGSQPAHSMSVVNEWDKFAVRITATEKADFWRFPVETVSLSESGFEKVYQSSVIVPFYSISLKAWQSREIELLLQIKNL